MKLTHSDDSLLQSTGLGTVDIGRYQALRERIVLSFGELKHPKAFRVGLRTDDVTHLDCPWDGGLGDRARLGPFNFTDLVGLTLIVKYAIGRIERVPMASGLPVGS